MFTATFGDKQPSVGPQIAEKFWELGTSQPRGLLKGKPLFHLRIPGQLHSLFCWAGKEISPISTWLTGTIPRVWPWHAHSLRESPASQSTRRLWCFLPHRSVNISHLKVDSKYRGHGIGVLLKGADYWTIASASWRHWTDRRNR